MNRVRLIIFNAALGPLDYRVPEGLDVEPGSVVVASTERPPIAERSKGESFPTIVGTRHVDRPWPARPPSSAIPD